MRKKYLVILTLLLFIPLFGSHSFNEAFLATAIDVNAGNTATNGSEFTSLEISIGQSSRVALTCMFTRAAGSASTVDFAFEASYDGGNNWATFEGTTIRIATNHSIISGTTVAVLKLANTPGISTLRLKSIKNNDGVNNLTNCNVILSY